VVRCSAVTRWPLGVRPMCGRVTRETRLARRCCSSGGRLFRPQTSHQLRQEVQFLSRLNCATRCPARVWRPRSADGLRFTEQVLKAILMRHESIVVDLVAVATRCGSSFRRWTFSSSSSSTTSVAGSDLAPITPHDFSPASSNSSNKVVRGLSRQPLRDARLRARKHRAQGCAQAAKSALRYSVTSAAGEAQAGEIAEGEEHEQGSGPISTAVRPMCASLHLFVYPCPPHTIATTLNNDGKISLESNT